jgi:hypothetical protein
VPLVFKHLELEAAAAFVLIGLVILRGFHGWHMKSEQVID